MRWVRTVMAMGSVLALLACQGDGTFEPQAYTRALAALGLEQEVRLRPEAPRTGDTVEFEWPGTITSPPGRYVLRVRHFLQPDVWVEIPVVVQE